MKAERQKLEEAITLQETLRGKVDDAIIEATIATLREKIATLEIRTEFPELQRKQVTIFFADIADSTRIVQHLDPEDIQEIIFKTIKRLSEPVNQHGGRVVRFMGDGYLAIFGIPNAHEDDPERAIRAGLDILDAAEKVAPDLERQWQIKDFRIRIGINTGLVAISTSKEEEYTLMGSAVNMAARLETYAQPGSMIISHDTYRHVRGVFTLEVMNAVKLKGFDEPVLAYKVLDAKPRAFRVLSRGVEGVETRMVGREAEFKYLQKAFNNMVDEQEGGVITISGDAGIGKSRLLYEYQNWIEFQPDIRLFQGRASQEILNTPFILLHNLFSFRFQIQDSDPLDVVHQKIETGFGQIFGMDENGIMHSHLIGQLLGFDFQESFHLIGVLDDPKRLYSRASAYLIQYFQELTQKYRCVIFLEDIHWADDHSLDLISQIAYLSQNRPLLIVCLARPLLYIRRPHWGEGLDYFHRLELEALNKRESRVLVDEILKKVEQVPAALRELVVSWAEGNPFYIEELIKMMIENGVIIVGFETWRVIPEKLAQVDVPATLTGVLQARLDSLPNEERITLRLASVIGRVFWEEAVEHLYPRIDTQVPESDDFDLVATLTSLREREIIYRREESTFSNTREYLFKHALLRDVAYESIPKKERREYHTATALWLRDITTPTGRSDEYAALIADHYLMAGKKGEAAEWLLRAGVRAKNQDAMTEARNYLTQAMDLIPEDRTESRWRILLERDEVLGILGDKEARLADDETLVKIAEASSDNHKLAEAYYRKAFYLYNIGQFQKSMADCAKAVDAARQAGNRKLEVLALGVMVVNQKNLGEIDAASETAEIVLAMADEHLDGKTLATTLTNIATVYENTDIQKSIQLYERSVELCNQIGNHFFMAVVLLNIGYSYVMAGYAEKGIEALNQALELNKTIGSPRSTIYNQLNLGFAYYRLGDQQTALDILKQVFDAIKKTEDPLAEAACHAYCGLVIEKVGEPVQAREHYRSAVQLYKQLGSQGYAQDALAGVARTELSLNNINAAHQLADQVWDYLSQNGAEGMEFPILAYLTCARIFETAHANMKMSAAIQGGYNELMERADKFNDPDWRSTYLQMVPEHFTMLEMWTDHHESIDSRRR